ncbi:hypothetical protein [Paraclostridium sordellii]|uniref:hypothetical protein n=1 Tax=Paraclostridium sordellii TaxID=1505 RepID=UPI0003859341|nr:hypothetical protein [Paeniclostridium sordellii]AUO31665.1 hypothetical protein [Paeniclostridium sordellii]AUO31759.1 hypothetical protein [Paeniclostridium sordellii]EPZ61733.1 hypothetical protein H476_3579 [[Clostridium] sordellii VPI 9048] [Paeniclostridium sordellii VPI 9048]CEK40105.1 hypothetical protein JGS6382_PCS1300641 (plasmid) [[Clostridium] sordellii] [Paeniclostridium sordellii]
MNFKKKVSTSLVLTLVGVTVATPILNTVSAMEDSITSDVQVENKIITETSEEVVAPGAILTKKVNKDGVIEATLNDNGVISNITYNPNSNETYLNGELLSTSIVMEENIQSNRYSWVYTGTISQDIPLGTALTTAASIAGIWLGIPASKVKQTLIALGYVTASMTLDGKFSLKRKQYRSSVPIKEGSMTVADYKYKTISSFIKNSNNRVVLGPYTDTFFGSRPMNL